MELLTTLGPLVLGVLAWCLGGAALATRRKSLSMLSLASCAVALLLALLYYHTELMTGDVAALLDTSDAMAWCAAVLLVVTLALNAAVLLRARR
ncbi:MAG TPA: hypothetical protein IAA56_01425 [Candidatus Galloscillospira excrementavium]|nr:hypothetical protein [Candidatus Galloscillospira excrementavium]